MEPLGLGSRQFHPSSNDYDNGVDDVQSPRYYIVWNMNVNTHIYPEFVVSFKVYSNLKGDILILQFIFLLLLLLLFPFILLLLFFFFFVFCVWVCACALLSCVFKSQIKNLYCSIIFLALTLFCVKLVDVICLFFSFRWQNSRKP